MRGYSGRVTSPRSLSPSPRHPGEGCRSCCPLVMTEHEEEPGERKEREKALESSSPPLSSLCLCPSLFLCLSLSLSLCMCPAALSSSGMRLKETICWSICLLLCLLCCRLSPYRWSCLAFPLPTLFVAANRHSGRGGCAVGGGVWGCALQSLIHTERERMGIGRHASFSYAHTING